MLEQKAAMDKILLSDIKRNSLKKRKSLRKTKTKVYDDMPETLLNSLTESYNNINYNYISPRFDVNDPNAYQYLKDNGYVVIKDVVPADDIEILKDMIWDWIEKLEFPFQQEKLDRNKPETWRQNNWPADPRYGIVGRFGIGQTNFQWKIRSYPSVKKVFSKIWNTSNLITSFDGINLYRPWKYNINWKTSGKWWHVDQNSRLKTSKGFQSVQGLVSLMDATPEVGGLCVIPGTHKLHEQVCSKLNTKFQFVPIPINDPLLKDPKLMNKAILVQCKAGDMCLWDSRTIHCNGPTNAPQINPLTKKVWDKNDPQNNDKKWDLIRMTSYICMTPSVKATNKILKLRHETAFKCHTTSTHWPQYFQFRIPSMFVKHEFTLNEYQKQLIGYPRGLFTEILWQFNDNFVNIAKLSVFIGVFGICVNKYKKARSSK